MARRPVHDRYQVQKATLDGDIGDVGAPDPIGLVDSHPFEKIRINPVHGMRHAGSRRLIDRLQAYQLHQPANPVTADANAVPPQLADHLAAAVERVLHEQLVDPTHQRQTRRALPPGRIIERGPADRKQAALTAQAQLGGVACDHRLALPPAHRLSPLAKKSRSTVSSPILA